MNKEYQYTRKSKYSTAGGYQHYVEVNVKSDNKKLAEYLENGIDELLDKYRKDLYKMDY